MIFFLFFAFRSWRAHHFIRGTVSLNFETSVPDAVLTKTLMCLPLQREDGNNVANQPCLSLTIHFRPTMHTASAACCHLKSQQPSLAAAHGVPRLPKLSTTASSVQDDLGPCLIRQVLMRTCCSFIVNMAEPFSLFVHSLVRLHDCAMLLDMHFDAEGVFEFVATRCLHFLGSLQHNPSCVAAVAQPQPHEHSRLRQGPH